MVLSTSNRAVSALRLLDEIIGSLARSGSGKGAVLRMKSDRLTPIILGFVNTFGLRRTAPKEWSIEGESAYDAAFMARAMLEVLMDYDPKIGLFSVEDQLGFYLAARFWPSQCFVSFAKYVVAWPMARYLMNDLPTKPEGFSGNPFIFTGAIKRFLKNRLISKSDKNCRLWCSWLQGIKRGCAPVTEEFIHAAMVKHRKALCSEKETPPDMSDKLDTFYFRFFRKFRRPKPRLFEASAAASWEYTRSLGGAREFLRDQLPDVELLDFLQVGSDRIVEIRGKSLPSFDEALERAKQSPTSVMVSAVLEPLKVRLITKGSSWRSYVSRFYQRGLWDYLQKFPQFVLTGKPLEVKDLEAVWDRTQDLKLPFDQFVSGDYSAATDNLDLWHTKRCFEQSLWKCDYDNDLLDVLRSLLWEQDLYYPSSMMKKGGLEPVKQRNGQLMGSVLSFPILCAINLCCYWAALEEYLDSRVEMESLPVLVNGDDILFMANQDFYAVWKRWIAAVGFELSLGKNYIHSELLTINSEFFRFKKSGNTFVKLGYLNTGLLIGQAKVSSRESGLRLRPIWDQFNETIPDSITPARTNQRFVHYRKSEIEEFTRKGTYNLYLPFERGGCGFTPHVEYFITSFQRRFATGVEARLRSDVDQGKVPSGLSLGLVRIGRPNLTSIEIPQHTKLRLVTKGELSDALVVYEPKLYHYPPLAQAYDLEKPEYKIRHPKKVHQFLENGHFERMSSEKIVSWPWILVVDPWTGG